MTARATEVLQYTTIKTFTVASGQIATRGFAVKHSGGDLAIANMAAVGDNCIGIALEDGIAGALVRVAMSGNGIVKVKVGTGGATRGSPAKYAANGLTDATVGGGTVKLVIHGQFVESGAVGDLVGLNLGMAAMTVGT